MNRTADREQFERAATWAEDRERQREQSVRRAWLIVWVLAAIAALEAFALIALVPLKSPVPYTILVDRQTGYVATLDPAQPARLGSDQALTRSMLVQYVSAREGFSRGSVRSDYRKVMSWSGGRARAAYARDMAASNPNSPLAKYSAGTVVEVRPLSVSELEKGSALVRFELVRSDAAGRAYPAVPFAGVIQYRFAPREMSVEERFINPLGFEVLRYRKDPESAPSQMSPNVDLGSPTDMPQ